MIYEIKAIIFDFDGVIAESVNVKTEAFAEIYRPYGENIVKKVVRHHLANGGVSRFDKFKIYHKEFLGKKITNKQIKVLSTQFSCLVVQKVINAPYVPGAIDFIKNNYKKYTLFISSGTPEYEMKKIAIQRKIVSYFKCIYGSPDTKNTHVRKIVKSNSYAKNEVVFIGDSTSDRDAALENKIHFIARVNDKDSPLLNEKNIIEDLRNLKRYLFSLTN